MRGRQKNSHSVEVREEMALRRIARGTLHTLSSAYVGRLVNWIAIFVLTRQLPPEDFGHVALAACFLAFVVSLRSFGLHNALLHNHERVHKLAPTHFILNTGLGMLGTLVAIALAVFFVDPQYGRNVATALVVFSAFDFLRAVALTAETQFRRDLEFSTLANAHALALIAAAAAGIAMAYLGGGIWALVLSHSVYGIGYVAVYCSLLWLRRSPLDFSFSDFDPEGARLLFRYGAWIWVGVILQTFLLNFDRLIVGALLDATALGFYDRAHVFAQLPTGALTHALTGIMIAVFARYSQDGEKLAAAFRRTLRWIIRTAVPFSILLAIEIPQITLLFLGEHWLPMASILRFLLLYSLCRPLLEAFHTFLRSIGDPRGFAVIVSAQATVLLFAAPLLTKALEITGTALAMNLTAIVGTIWAMNRTTRYVNVPWFRTLAPPLLAGLVATGFRFAAGWLMEDLAPTVSFFLGILFFLLNYGTALLILEGRGLISELKTLWSEITKKTDPN